MLSWPILLFWFSCCSSWQLLLISFCSSSWKLLMIFSSFFFLSWINLKSYYTPILMMRRFIKIIVNYSIFLISLIQKLIDANNFIDSMGFEIIQNIHQNFFFIKKIKNSLMVQVVFSILVDFMVTHKEIL